MAEQGYPGFEMTQWYGLLAPASLPQPAVAKLAEATIKAVKSPTSVERLSADAALVAGSTPEGWASLVLGNDSSLVSPQDYAATESPRQCSALDR